MINTKILIKGNPNQEQYEQAYNLINEYLQQIAKEYSIESIKFEGDNSKYVEFEIKENNKHYVLNATFYNGKLEWEE